MAQIQSILLGHNTFFEDAEMPSGPSLMLVMTRPLLIRSFLKFKSVVKSLILMQTS